MEIAIQTKAFPALGGARRKTVLEDIRLSLDHGEFVAVFGPSGCGKTTLLNIVAGLDRDFAGAVDLNPTARRFGEAGEGGHRPRVGYVFQTARLLPWMTVEDNIRLVLPSREGAGEKVSRVLADVELEEARTVYPNRLSVGMSRRAALARAFVVEPDILLLDEPFVSLDEATAIRLRGLLVSLLGRRPTTVLFVTHDLAEAILLADRIVFLAGSPAGVVADVTVDPPRDRRTREAVERFRAELLDRSGGVIRRALDLGE
jgi:NitT/TauT family transport system ATP-binding protein